MDKFSDETLCRICFQKQDTVYSLFRKRKGISPSEKLNKIGVKADLHDTGPSCICCDCLAELETTVNFLEKCEKSNRVLADYLADSLKDNNAVHCDSRVVEFNQEECESIVGKQEVGNDEELLLEDPRCEECGSRRRCQHWSPPTTHTCPKCQKVFNRKFNFKLHLKRHSETREWWCAQCGAGVVSRWLAATHCAPRAPRPCPVPGCQRAYTSTTNLRVHLRAHTVPNEQAGGAYSAALGGAGGGARSVSAGRLRAPLPLGGGAAATRARPPRPQRRARARLYAVPGAVPPQAVLEQTHEEATYP
ncbi:hypothetical protein HF086_002954, partial [Spodoptera exigua]